MRERFRHISLASFLIAVPSLLLELTAFVDAPADWGLLPRYLFVFGKYVQLTFFNFDFTVYRNFNSFFSANYLDIAFYVTMLVAAVAYSLSKGKETRMIRFCFAVIAISAVVSFVQTASHIVLEMKYYSSDAGNALRVVLFLLRDVGALLLGWYVLSSFNTEKAMVVYKDHVNEDTLLSTPKGDRLVHHIIDSFLAILIFSALLSFFSHYLSSFELHVDSRFVLFVVVSVFRFAYYLLTECLLKTTPGKLLTESRIVTFRGGVPSNGTIVVRTLCRFIPFEPFSFFGTSGWHDTLSETAVVKEVRTGIHGGWYVLLLPLFILLGVGGYFGYEVLKKYEEKSARAKVLKKHLEMFRYELKNLSSSHYLEVRRKGWDGDGNVIYLRVDSVRNENVHVTILTTSPAHKVITVPPRFKEDSLLLHTVLSRRQLEKMIPLDDAWQDRVARQGGVSDSTFLSDVEEYVINSYFIEGAPIIPIARDIFGSGPSVHFTGDNRERITMTLQNCGWGGSVVAVNNIECHIDWITPLPLNIDASSNDSYNCTPFSLEGVTNDREYAVEIVIEDANRRRSIYRVEGTWPTRARIEQVPVPGTSL